MDAREKLLRLLRLQELATGIRAARAIVDGAAARIEEIERQFRERNAEYVALKEHFDELDRDQRDRSGELDLLEQSRRKYTDDLMQVRNQREYAAILKEIDAVKAKIGEHEEAILKDLDGIETLKADLDSRAAHINEERAQVEEHRAQVEAEAAEAGERISRFDEERASIETELPADLVDTVRRVEEGRQGLFLARVDGEMCQACFVRIRPQVFQEIRQAAQIHCCANCRRFLYYEPALRPDPPEPPPQGAGAPDLWGQ